MLRRVKRDDAVLWSVGPAGIDAELDVPGIATDRDRVDVSHVRVQLTVSE